MSNPSLLSKHGPNSLNRKQRGISREALKGIACISMLIAHMCSTSPYVPQFSVDFNGMLLAVPIYNAVGTIAFPIFTFLIVEGYHHTRSVKKYALRLLAFALLSELPFDLYFKYKWTPGFCNVLFTHLLGLLALVAVNQSWKWYFKAAAAASLAGIAELIGSDGGAAGVAMALLFEFTRNVPWKQLLRAIGIFLLLASGESTLILPIGKFLLNIRYLSPLAMIPISLYNSEKIVRRKLPTLLFYAIYPLHLLAAYAVRQIPL